MIYNSYPYNLFNFSLHIALRFFLILQGVIFDKNKTYFLLNDISEIKNREHDISEIKNREHDISEIKNIIIYIRSACFNYY